eukprot:Skav232496  [mRNA]  locus=scaffold3757:160175:160816:+ [translate_table: standard]
MVHRQASEQVVSQWRQWTKRRKNGQETFGVTFLEQANARFSPNHAVRIWDTISTAAPGPVGVSYEYLRERNYSIAAFLFCNVTLRLEGTPWKQCLSSIAQQERNTPSANVSPSNVAVDVVRLAIHLQRQEGLHCTHRIYPEIVSVEATALQMPTACGTFEAFFKKGDDAWFKKSSAARSRIRSTKECCFLDETKLTQFHWKLIRNVSELGNCS